MFVNWQLRELNLKIVYYGPALSGKTTNLEKIHAHISPKRRGDLVSLKTSEDRTLYFDFMQLELGKISGLTPKIQLYTVPGQAYYEASRKLVLRGADGIVFVADSAPDRLKANKIAWENMKAHLLALNLPLDLPVVVQFNKRDLPDALPLPHLRRALGTVSVPIFEAVAQEGTGVPDTLKMIINKVVKSIQREVA
ncbi:MAG: ADP-ribosylation factor-like protein [Chloroflexota bacterium]